MSTGLENPQGNGAHQAPAAPTQPTAPAAQPASSALSQAFAVGQPPATPGGAMPQGAGQSWREKLAARGYDVSGYQSDDDAFDAMVATADAYEQHKPLINHGREFLTEREQYLAWKQQQAEAQAAAAQSATPQTGFKWEVPEFREEWLQQVKQGPGGRCIPLNEYVSPAVAEKVNAYLDWQTQTSRRVLTDFPKLIDEATAGRFQAFEQRFQEHINQRISQALEWYDTVQRQTNYIRQHASDFYVLDDQGRPQVDAQGRQLLTPVGQAMLHYANEARAYGITDPMRIRSYAEKFVSADMATGKLQDNAQPPTPNAPMPQAPNGASAAAPNVPPPSKRETFLQRASRSHHVQQRTGTLPSPNQPTNPQNSRDALSAFDEEMAARGLV